MHSAEMQHLFRMLTLAALERLIPSAPAAEIGDPELARVLALPERVPPTDDVVRALSVHCRKRSHHTCSAACRPGCPRNGTENLLRGQQASVLIEGYEYGCIAPIPVGAGKTLPTFLLPFLINAARPMLMVPAALREKTKRDFADYAQDWRVRLPEIVSYEEMYRADRHDLLTRRMPDLLMADECDPLMNDNACARRVRRYCREHRPRFVPMSGTLIGDKLERYHGVTTWALGSKAPMPTSTDDAERWASALDSEVKAIARHDPGALGQIPGGFHHHFRTRRGVVCGQGVACPASIRASVWEQALPEVLAQTVREVAASGMRPDGEILDEWGLPDCLCRIALGHYPIWDPAPPSWWLRPRRAFWSAIRELLAAEHPDFDTAGQIVTALDRTERLRNGPVQRVWTDTIPKPEYAAMIEADPEPDWPDECYQDVQRVVIDHPGDGPRVPGHAELAELLAEWRAVKDRFEPTPVPVWLDVSPLVEIMQRAKANPGTLVWTPFVAVGQMLELMGLPYYGADRDPETAPPGHSIAVSVMAHHRGKNLQAWHRNTILRCPAKAKINEQLIGRTHRPGQNATSIFLEYLGSISYHRDVLDRVMAEARAVTRASGVQQKLTLADWQ